MNKIMRVIQALLILFLTSCSSANKQEKERAEEENQKLIVNAISHREDISRLVGKNIRSIDTIVPERKGKSRVLFIFNFYL